VSGGGSTISNVQPSAGNLRIQTSVFGSAIAIAYGRPRISGNLLWFGSFMAIPHTSTTSSGGKGGGGVTQSDTSWTYTAAVMLSLGEGVINDVLTVWKGKQMVSSVLVPAHVVSTVAPNWFLGGGGESFYIDASRTAVVAHAADFVADMGVVNTATDANDNYPDTGSTGP